MYWWLFLKISCMCVLLYFIIDAKKQESTVGGGTSRHCFYGLQPDSQYKISVYSKVQETEGPSVSIVEKTRKSSAFPPEPRLREQFWGILFQFKHFFPFRKILVIAAQEYLQYKFCSSSPVPEFTACAPLMSSGWFFHPSCASEGMIRPSDGKVLETMTYIVI